MDDELLKLECLEAAQNEGLKGPEALKRAKEIFDWLKGRNQGEGLKPIDPKAPQARVVGRDTNFEPPFDDYVKKN